jgi:murein DD-endopeptidase MepM/ murein hydrolase activator NlpD
VPYFLAWLHLIALGVGLAGVWSRARAIRDSLRNPSDPAALRRVYTGDIWWTSALLIWLVTGTWRVLAGTDRLRSDYLESYPFLIKTSLFLALLALELWPMTTLIRWRARKLVPNPLDAGRIEAISYVQCALVAAIVLASVAMPRGVRPTATTDVAIADSSVTGATVATAPRDTTDDPEPLEPSGTETVTPEDLALLAREVGLPLDAIDPTKLRSTFDERRGGGTRQHQALDIMAPRGTPIRSVAKGRVLRLFTSANGGLMLYAADSSERFIFQYAHLDAYAPGLRDGAALERGQIIGTVGSTGNASPTAPHLHFAIARSADVKRWSRGKPIDPLPVLVQSATAR